MAINPEIPIPSAMPRVSLERPFNGAENGEEDEEDDEDEDVAACVDNMELVIVPKNGIIAKAYLYCIQYIHIRNSAVSL